MQASVEISMYPLRSDYKKSILEFIDRLNQHESLTVRTNNMSTQVFGDYDVLMAALNREVKQTFAQEPTTIMVFKLINADLQ